MRAPISILAAICAVIVGFSFAPDSAERGLEAFRRRDFKTAESEFAKLTSEKPDSARAWKLLGMTYIAEEKYEPAEEPCRKPEHFHSMVAFRRDCGGKCEKPVQ